MVQTGRSRVRIACAFCLAAAITASSLAPSALRASESAVFFVYQRFGVDRFPTASVTLEQFEAHLEEITTGDYNVATPGDVVAAFRRRDTLLERTIAITIDGADASVYAVAWPRLRKAGVPFALFVSTDVVDAGRPGYMSWDQIRELSASGVAIGNLTASHPHLPELGGPAKAQQLARANRRFAQELGFRPTLLAYPYGAYGLAEKRLAKESQFVAAFGQHSGLGHPDADFFGLPRFLLNKRFGSISRFRLAANALPLYVDDLTPADTVVTAAANPPSFGFTLAAGQGPLATLSCFASNRPGPARIERLGERRIELRFETPFPPGRGRINCTMPAKGDHWRWFGLQLYIPKG